MTHSNDILAADRSLKEIRNWSIVTCSCVLAIFLLTLTVCTVYQTYNASYYANHAAKSLHKIAKTTAHFRREHLLPSCNSSSANMSRKKISSDRVGNIDAAAQENSLRSKQPVQIHANGGEEASAANGSEGRLGTYATASASGGEHDGGSSSPPPFLMQSRRKRSARSLRKQNRPIGRIIEND